MSVKITSNKSETYYHNGKSERDPEFMDARVFFEHNRHFGPTWNLHVRKCIDARGLLSWDMISKLQDRKEVEQEALKFMATGKIKSEWCRGVPPNF